MNKVQLLASFHDRVQSADKRGRSRVYEVVRHVRFRSLPTQQIECSCGCVLPYSPLEHDVDQLAVLNRVCDHIEALYRGRAPRVTERGRELFAWGWAQLALERST